jgi:hypothetical protein
LWLSPGVACLHSGGMTFPLTLPSWFRRVAILTAAPRRSFELLAGQRLELSLAAADGLHVCAGEVVLLRPPRWIGDALVAPGAVRLREGDAWTSVEREHVTLMANTSSRIVRVAG